MRAMTRLRLSNNAGPQTVSTGVNLSCEAKKRAFHQRGIPPHPTSTGSTSSAIPHESFTAR